VLNEPTEVYRSTQLAACDEQAFVLTALGIASEILWTGTAHSLLVEAAQAAAARTHLARYAAEASAARAAAAAAAREPVPPADHPDAWLGAALYALLLYVVSFAIANGFGRLDAFSLGELSGDALRAGQWWRAVTALTLHRDLAHLAGNLGFGVWIGYYAGARLGPGIAWALTLLAAAGVNLLDGRFGPAQYRSVGASTAVFAALGLVAAVTWRERRRTGVRRLLRWSPLVAGVILLGWTGSEGENTDLVAHGLGFVCGVLCGVLAASAPVRRVLQRVPQWLAGGATLALVALAWVLALRS
jgi:rhomboid protease GluP